MAGFTQDVLKSQGARDVNEVNKLNKELQDAQNAILRMQGRGQKTYDPFNTAAQQQWQQSEQQRRIAAAPAAAGVASTIDERVAGAANQLAGIYDKYNQTNADLAQRQAQSAATTGMELEQGLKTVEQQKDKFDFSMYQNQTQRDDAIEALWSQGLADDKMLDAAIKHQVKLQDIEKYYALLMNEIEQDLANTKTMRDNDWLLEKQKIESRASNNSSIISGLMGIIGTAIAYS